MKTAAEWVREVDEVHDGWLHNSFIRAIQADAAMAQRESDMDAVGTSQCLCLENLRQNPLVTEKPAPGGRG